MSKRILAFLFFFSTMAALATGSNAQTLIHYWHFNSINVATQGKMVTAPTNTITPIMADYTDLPGYHAAVLYAEMPGTPTGYSSYIDTFTADISTYPYDFDTVNVRMGQPEGYSIRARNPSADMQLLFYLPSKHFTNLVLTYGTESSSLTHGQLQQIYSYSLDSGASWITSGGLSVPSFSLNSAYNDTFRRATVTFTDAHAFNNPNLVFRITFSGNDTASSGNNRFDNITLEGDSILVETGVNGVTAQPVYNLYPNPVNNNLYITSTVDGAKSVAITNMVGQNVYFSEETGSYTSVNTAAFKPGIYFVAIRESNTGAVTTMRFVKQ